MYLIKYIYDEDENILYSNTIDNVSLDDIINRLRVNKRIIIDLNIL